MCRAPKLSDKDALIVARDYWCAVLNLHLGNADYLPNGPYRHVVGYTELTAPGTPNSPGYTKRGIG